MKALTTGSIETVMTYQEWKKLHAAKVKNTLLDYFVLFMCFGTMPAMFLLWLFGIAY